MYLITWITTGSLPILRDGWLSWPCWLTDSGRHNHKVVTHPASSLAQDRESSPAETSGLTTMLRRQQQWHATFHVEVEGEVRLGTGGDLLHDDSERVDVSFATGERRERLLTLFCQTQDLRRHPQLYYTHIHAPHHCRRISHRLSTFLQWLFKVFSVSNVTTVRTLIYSSKRLHRCQSTHSSHEHIDCQFAQVALVIGHNPRTTP